MVKQNSEIKNFWIIFLAVLAVLSIATAVFVAVTSANKVAKMQMSVVNDENYYKVSQENTYKHSLYAACDSMKNLDANLGKVAISNNSGNQAQMLANVVVHANQINGYLANLPIAYSDNFEACQKFVNQTQDFATYLLKKISNGQQLSMQERAALRSLDNVATNLYNMLQAYAESDGNLFITNGNGLNNNGTLSDSFDQMDSNAFRYEKLIYDGPFSDSVQQKTLQAGKAISHEEGQKVVEQLFGKATFAQAINNNGLWYCYNLQNGRVLLACDGRVAQFETYRESSVGQPLSKEKCIEIAQAFCQKLGYDVRGVWVSKTQEQTTYVNCATVIDGVIVYPELIKVAVDSYSGEVVGCEAKAYLLNHTERDVTFGKVSQTDAQKAVDAELEVTNVAKSLVEKGNKQYLCYEFQCNLGERQYYVYVDSNTGEEVEIFKVIQNTEGYTVM